MINVKLHPILKDYCPNSDGYLQIKYEEDLTVKDILKNLNFNPGAVGLVLVLKNEEVARNDDRLSDGDNIEIYPFFDGG